MIPRLALVFAFCGTLAAAAEDPRSVEVLRYGCGSEFGRHEITLFGNGTVRVREGLWEDQQLYLDELTPEALADNLRLLASFYSDRDTDQIREPLSPGVGGYWLERCELFLDLPDFEEPLLYRFSSTDVPPLRVARIIHVAEELAEYTRPLAPEERLSPDYEPQFGDVLRTVDGVSFRVLRLTADGKGVELQGVEQPVRLFVALEDLADAFVSVEEQEDPAWWWRQ